MSLHRWIFYGILMDIEIMRIVKYIYLIPNVTGETVLNVRKVEIRIYFCILSAYPASFLVRPTIQLL